MPALAMTTQRQAIVIGLGQTGLSCVAYLTARGYRVTVMDTRPTPPRQAELQAQYPAVELHTGGLRAQALLAADIIVVSPGVSLKEPALAQAVRAGRAIVGDIELFAQNATAPVLAITGANGKSTVTSLVGAMCREAGMNAAVGGNIGVPVLDLLAQPPAEVYVLELSSFQLETTHSLNARAATVLNITPDHMDRYDSLAEYAAAKARIFHGDGVMVLNRDDAMVMAMHDMVTRQRPNVSFGLNPPPREIDYGVVGDGVDEWLVRGARRLLPAREIPLPGRHNIANVLAAMALAESVEVPVDAMTRAVMRFKGLAHRTQLVAEVDDVRWINDSKGTNVGATVAALNGMTQPVILIAGGDGKGQDFSALRAPLAEHARALVLIGRDAPAIERAVQGAVAIAHARDMHDAVRQAARLAQSGDVVLLSPACASFDMFKNYEHRGAVFAQAVQQEIVEARA